jgi:mannose/fructose/N-acetylgalactosamine-specific phosphotransferase system component IIB
VAIELYRIDDRLIHGQVVLGWGRPLNVGFIVLVDDEVAASDWEQELYRMGVPPEIDVFFVTALDAAIRLDDWRTDARSGIVLTGDIDTMRRLIDAACGIGEVNLGGVHYRADRVQRLRYVYLSPEEERTLRALAARGVRITAQDVPAARPLPLEDVLLMQGDS